MFQYSHYDPTCWLNLAPDMTFLESFPLYIYIYIYTPSFKTMEDVFWTLHSKRQSEF